MKLTIITSLFLLFTLDAWAAGYQLRYQGAEAMGTSFASQGTYGTSLSSVYYNPALFLKQGKKRAFAVELMSIIPTEAEFTSSATNTTYDDFADTTFSGALFFGYKIDDTTAFTLALTTPWATDTEYADDWEGQFAAIKTQLRTFNLQPVISKALNDKWAISVGPQIQLAQGTLSSRIPPGVTGQAGIDGEILELDGDHLGVGAVLAVTYTPNDHLVFNLTYNSQIRHSINGDVSIDSALGLESDAQAEIYTPDVINLGVSHIYNEKWVSHFNFSYTNWSLFRNFDVENSPSGNPAADIAAGELPFNVPNVPQNWQDTYFVAMGATYNANANWTFRGGVSYETSAVENEDRTPRTQDSDRIGVGLGTSYRISQVLNLDFGINQIIYLGDIELEPSADLPLNPTGEYDTAATLARVGLEYVF